MRYVKGAVILGAVVGGAWLLGGPGLAFALGLYTLAVVTVWYRL